MVMVVQSLTKYNMPSVLDDCRHHLYNHTGRFIYPFMTMYFPSYIDSQSNEGLFLFHD
jgi:hypothetical protein